MRVKATTMQPLHDDDELDQDALYGDVNERFTKCDDDDVLAMANLIASEKRKLIEQGRGKGMPFLDTTTNAVL